MSTKDTVLTWSAGVRERLTHYANMLQREIAYADINTWIDQQRADARSPKPGEHVWIVRGSTGNPPGTTGALRRVRGIVERRMGAQYIVQLAEDDPLSSSEDTSKTGHTGLWGQVFSRGD